MFNTNFNQQNGVTMDEFNAVLTEVYARQQAAGTNAPLSDAEFIQILNDLRARTAQAQQQNAGAQSQANGFAANFFNAKANTQGSATGQFVYEYTEIKDLYLPNLDEEAKAKAILLANEIEKLRVSIKDRQAKFISVSDIEIENLNRMIKEFRSLTGASFTGAIKNATRGMKTKYTGTVEKVETKVTQAIDDLEETANGVIDSFVALGTETLKFGGVFAKGTLNIGSTAAKGILKTGFNIIK